MSISHPPVGELLDAFVGQLPHPPTADRRIDHTACIVAATVATVQASLDAPFEHCAAKRAPDSLTILRRCCPNPTWRSPAAPPCSSRSAPPCPTLPR